MQPETSCNWQIKTSKNSAQLNKYAVGSKNIQALEKIHVKKLIVNAV